MKALFLPLTVGMLAGPAMVHASSDDAWEAFRENVETTCRALVEAPETAQITIEVNPFGSETYGAALVTVDYGDAGQDRQICIFNKQAETAELTAPFTPADQTAREPTVRDAERPAAKP